MFKLLKQAFFGKQQPCEVCGEPTRTFLGTYICYSCLVKLLRVGVIFLKKANEIESEAFAKMKISTLTNENAGGLE